MSSQLNININTDLKLNKAILIKNDGKKIIKKTKFNNIKYFKKRIRSKLQNGQSKTCILQTLSNQTQNEVTQTSNQDQESEVLLSKDYKNFLKLEKRKNAKNTYHMYLCLKFNNFEKFLNGLLDGIRLDERCLHLLNDNFEYYSLIDKHDFYWRQALFNFNLQNFPTLLFVMKSTTVSIK